MPRLSFRKLTGRSPGYHLAATTIPDGVTTARHTHDFPEWFVVAKGSGRHQWNGNDLPVERGDLVWIFASDHHSFCATDPKGLEVLNLALDPRWWRKFAALAGKPLPTASPHPTEPLQSRLSEADLAQLDARLRQIMLGGDPGEFTLAWLVAHVWRLLTPHLLRPELGDAGRPPPWLNRLAAELTIPANLTLPIGHWQKRSGRTPEHLARSCQRFYGMTLTELRIRAKLAFARQLLLSGEEKIAFVALEAGFNNLSHFHREFRAHEGCTPQVWRLRYRQGNAIPH